MGEDELMRIMNRKCNHFEQRHYTQKRLDILNGFELVFTRCINCHKVLNLKARRIRQIRTISNAENNWLKRWRDSPKKIIHITKEKINDLHYWLKNL